MGATTFTTSGKGKSADEVFAALRAKLQYERGHEGYTGTIAEKRSFVPIAKVKTWGEARSMADNLIEARDARIDDKWGPAGCIEVEEKPNGTVGERSFLFFGWASE